MRSMSSKKRASLAAYKRAREAVQERSGGRCEARAFPGCTGWGEHAHHVLRRSQGGTDTPDNLLWVCGSSAGGFCHGWIHDHPAEAAKKGLLKLRKAVPDDDLAPCICGRMSRQVPCWRCVEEDERHEF